MRDDTQRMPIPLSLPPLSLSPEYSIALHPEGLRLQYHTPAPRRAFPAISFPSDGFAFRRVFFVDDVLRPDRHVHHVWCFGVEFTICCLPLAYSLYHPETRPKRHP